MDLFVLIMSILVPLTSPLIGMGFLGHFFPSPLDLSNFKLEIFTVRKGFREVWLILSELITLLIGIVVDWVHQRTKDSTKTMITGCIVIYSVLIVYSITVFANHTIARWFSYAVLSVAKSFGLWANIHL